MIGYIYETTNLVNGRKYIGLHSGKYNKNYLGSGKLLKQAVGKYGKENFRVIILEECETLENLDLAEIKWIEKTNAVNSYNYYNLIPGGLSGTGEGFKKYWKKEINKNKASQRMKLEWSDIEIREIRTEINKKIWSTKEKKNYASERSKKMWETRNKNRQSLLIKELNNEGRMIVKGTRNGKSKKWLFIDPDKNKHNICGGLQTFCKQYNISEQMIRNHIDKGIIETTRYAKVEKCANTIGWEVRREN